MRKLPVILICLSCLCWSQGVYVSQSKTGASKLALVSSSNKRLATVELGWGETFYGARAVPFRKGKLVILETQDAQFPLLSIWMIKEDKATLVLERIVSGKESTPSVQKGVVWEYLTAGRLGMTKYAQNEWLKRKLVYNVERNRFLPSGAWTVAREYRDQSKSSKK